MIIRKMSYSKQIKAVSETIEELQEISKLLDGIEEKVVAIEDAITSLDNSLPDNNEYDAMKEGPHKQELRKLFDLLGEAYKLIDDILGPPEDDFDVDEILKRFPVRGNGRLN